MTRHDAWGDRTNDCLEETQLHTEVLQTRVFRNSQRLSEHRNQLNLETKVTIVGEEIIRRSACLVLKPRIGFVVIHIIVVVPVLAGCDQ